MTKSKTVKLEALKALAHLQELELLAKEAEIEEANIITQSTEQIDEICTKNSMYCGVVITPESLTEIVNQMIVKGGNVRVKYNLYFIDKEN